jgi:multidrug efflux pump subunit AcrA (membrane-fusion protein)
VQIAKTNVDRCSIKAPFSGQVVEKIANEYENITPQDKLIKLVNNNKLQANIIVPSNWLIWLKEGQRFKLKIDELDKIVEAKVTTIDKSIDSKSQSLGIRASIKNRKNLIDGMSATAQFEIPKGDKNGK